MPRVISTAVFLLYSLSLHSFPISGFKKTRCSKQVLETLIQWGSKDQWKTSSPLRDGSSVISSPSKEFGSWVEVLFHPNRNGNLLLRKHRYESEVLVEYLPKENCRPRILSQSKLQAKIRKQDWDDEKIGRFIKNNSKGAYLLWSPHMPYSWHAVNQIRKLKESHKNLNLVVLLDPSSDLQKAEEIRKKYNWPKRYLSKVFSIEFLMRSYHLHAPTLVPFSSGELGVALPGYRPLKFMEKFLKKQRVL